MSRLDLPVNHFGVILHGEGDTGRRLPDVLNILKALADATNLVRNQIGRKEADLELPKITLPGTRLGDRPKIVQELVLNRPPANPLPPCTIRKPTLGLPGATPDRCNNVGRSLCTGLWGPRGRGSLSRRRRRSTATSSGQQLSKECHPSSDPARCPCRPLGLPATVTPGRLLASLSGAKP